jgi:hypothetical protein
VVTGYQSFSTPGTALNNNGFTPAATLTLPVGAFLVNATVTTALSQPDTIDCELTDAAGNQLDFELSGSSGPDFLALTGVTASGGTETVSCSDGNGAGATVEIVSITAIPVTSVAAKRAQLNGRHGLPSLLRPTRPHAAPGSARHHS